MMADRHNASRQAHTDGRIRAVKPFFKRPEIMSPLLAIIGLYIFSSAFFLSKRSMTHTSMCDGNSASDLLQEYLGLTVDETTQLKRDGIIQDNSNSFDGCWVGRRVDSMVILVVDALRFDFARYHLPNSLGSRLQENHQSEVKGRSELLQFVADPPTVTMQRLKGLTTGGLPTFADISGSFGGASVDEDTWVQQLKDTPPSRRGMPSSDKMNPKLAFVGDDTWTDLFPTQFDDSHPFPSFNTRDLDTVDNGCLKHLPRLMKSFGRTSVTSGGQPEFFEVLVAHFLGVDHVGHTFGPHTKHMTDKLKQMDQALSIILDSLDDSPTNECQVAFIFGDHGMTEDGNHGGGSREEINAALFAHFSPGCGDMRLAKDIDGSESGIRTEEAFQIVNQIDLVPTISFLLGLPIPFANLGGVIPSLLPPHSKMEKIAPIIATTLALNAAQVWRYLTVYSDTANKLPALDELHTVLQDAVGVYRSALAAGEDAEDSLAYREACAKLKLFLGEATGLGKRVWTRFNTFGMIVGASVVFLSLILGLPLWFRSPERQSKIHFYTGSECFQVAVTLILMAFQCILLTFSNSYINEEIKIIQFFLAIICIMIAGQGTGVTNTAMTPSTLFSDNAIPLLLPFCSRIGNLFVTGHGLDPSIHLHLAHSMFCFLPCMASLAFARWEAFRRGCTFSRKHALLDCATLFFLVWSWIEKRSPDPERNGFLFCRITLAIILFSGALLAFATRQEDFQKVSAHPNRILVDRVVTAGSKLLAFIMTVTGPSTAASSCIFLLSVWILLCITNASGRKQVPDITVAALWRLVIRFTYFATGHACSFNRLQYSAAFVATMEFYFGIGGLSLFLNTFGWEILGILLVVATSIVTRRQNIWTWFCFYQLLESFGACISVSLMRRHLMVWAIFAPRFVWASIFLFLNASARIITSFFI